MNIYIKILLVWMAVWLPASAPLNAGAADSVRFRHTLSLYTDEQGGGLSLPQGVVCPQDSVLVVADTGNNRLLRYTLSADGAKPKVLELRPEAMVFPQRMRANHQGELYVYDGKLRRVLHLSPQGRFLGFIDPQGLPSSDRTVIRSFDIDRRNNLYFLDVYSKRVVVCGAGGTIQKQMPFPATDGFFSDIAVGPAETVFLLDSINAQVFAAKAGAAAFAPLSRNLKEYVRFPTSLTLDRQGRIYLSDHNGSKIVILAPTGAFIARLSALGWKEGMLNHPSQICLNEQGQLFAADTSNNRVQVFSEVK